LHDECRVVQRGATVKGDSPLNRNTLVDPGLVVVAVLIDRRVVVLGYDVVAAVYLSGLRDLREAAVTTVLVDSGGVVHRGVGEPMALVDVGLHVRRSRRLVHDGGASIVG